MVLRGGARRARPCTAGRSLCWSQAQPSSLPSYSECPPDVAAHCPEHVTSHRGSARRGRQIARVSPRPDNRSSSTLLPESRKGPRSPGIFACRGPAQVKFSSLELRELGQVPDVDGEQVSGATAATPEAVLDFLPVGASRLCSSPVGSRSRPTRRPRARRWAAPAPKPRFEGSATSAVCPVGTGPSVDGRDVVQPCAGSPRARGRAEERRRRGVTGPRIPVPTTRLAEEEVAARHAPRREVASLRRSCGGSHMDG